MEANQIKKTIILSEEIYDLAFENMLKSFIHQVKKDGIIEEVRNRRYYMKPSEKKRLAQKGQRHG